VGNSRDHDWTEARVAALSELWLAGTTGLEIAGRLGVTRSSVMGKLRRLGLLRQGRPRMPIVRRPQIPQMRTNKRSLPPPEPYRAPPPPPVPPIGSFNLLDLRNGHCRWPEGERPDYRFCGRPQALQSSYCEIHHRLSLSHGSQRDFDRQAEQALAGKLFASRAGIEQ